MWDPFEPLKRKFLYCNWLYFLYSIKWQFITRIFWIMTTRMEYNKNINFYLITPRHTLIFKQLYCPCSAICLFKRTHNLDLKYTPRIKRIFKFEEIFAEMKQFRNSAKKENQIIITIKCNFGFIHLYSEEKVFLNLSRNDFDGTVFSCAKLGTINQNQKSFLPQKKCIELPCS